MISQEFRNLWADALESGEYKQGHGTLSKEGEYCCLGVACEILVQAGKLQRYDMDPDFHFYGPVGEDYDNSRFRLSSDWQSAVLPGDAIKELGISYNGDLKIKNHDLVIDDAVTPTLTYLNDKLLWDFKKIARVIRGEDETYELKAW